MTTRVVLVNMRDSTQWLRERPLSLQMRGASRANGSPLVCKFFCTLFYVTPCVALPLSLFSFLSCSSFFFLSFFSHILFFSLSPSLSLQTAFSSGSNLHVQGSACRASQLFPFHHSAQVTDLTHKRSNGATKTRATLGQERSAFGFFSACEGSCCKAAGPSRVIGALQALHAAVWSVEQPGGRSGGQVVVSWGGPAEREQTSSTRVWSCSSY